MSDIAVIIVNYGTADLAIAAVESVLEREHGGHDVKMHVVDNASPGGDAETLAAAHAERRWGKQVTLWPETENHGFGRGNNVVLEALTAQDAPPEFVFLLNPDARLENEAIAVLAGALADQPDAGAAGAGIVDPDGVPVTAAFRFPTMGRELMGTLNLGVLNRMFPTGSIPLSPKLAESSVDWVAGAAVLMRFETLRAIGFFDPEFFLYYEEVELMHRMNRAGHIVLYVPDARVTHLEGAATEVRSSDARPSKPVYVYQSWRLYFLKTHGRVYALLTAVLKLPAALLNLILAWVRLRPPALPTGFFRNHWRYALRPLLTGAAE